MTLGMYVVGDKTASGYAPRRLKKVRMSLAQIIDVFRGDQDFVGWNNPPDVIERAERWLKNGEPYQTVLSAASQTLAYVKKMRNVIAHQSPAALAKYTDATRKLYGALPPHCSPGDQLQQPPPRAIPGLTGATFFEATINIYRRVAAGVAP